MLEVKMPDTNSLALKLADWEESLIRAMPPVLGMTQEYMVIAPGDVYDTWETHMREHTTDNPWDFKEYPVGPEYTSRGASAKRSVSAWPRAFSMTVVRSASLASDFDAHA